VALLLFFLHAILPVVKRRFNIFTLLVANVSFIPNILLLLTPGCPCLHFSLGCPCAVY